MTKEGSSAGDIDGATENTAQAVKRYEDSVGLKSFGLSKQKWKLSTSRNWQSFIFSSGN
jgi:hypothetical protein